MDAPVESSVRAEIIGEVLADASARLAAVGTETARLDAEVLLACACDTDRRGLYLRLRESVAPDCAARFRSMLARRLAREPLQYITAQQEFWSLDFVVTPDVLIPRPETELLVELTMRLQPTPRTLCDLGTGSGCIAVALARALPGANIWALDASPRALAAAERNARRHGVADRIRFVASNLFAAVAGRRFDVIVSNPPYVASAELERLQPELRWEPRAALDGGASGLEVIAPLLAAAPQALADGGWLVMEIGADQGPAAEELARAARFGVVSVRADYAGLPRVLLARR